MQSGLFSNQRETTSEQGEGGREREKTQDFLSPHHIVQPGVPSLLRYREAAGDARESGDQLAVLCQWRKRDCKSPGNQVGKSGDLRRQQEVGGIRGVRMREIQPRRKD